MRSTWRSLIALAAAVAFVPQLATADEAEDRLRRMEERLMQLEDKLSSTETDLDAATQRVAEQEQMIVEAGLANDRLGSSKLAEFLETLEISGFVAGSYLWNFNDPDNQGFGGLAAAPNAAAGGFPFHPDHNAFSLDQLWLELARPVSEEHRAGFVANFVFGKTADLLNGGGAAGDSESGSFNDFHLYEGYVQYLAPVGEGVTFKFGKFGTVIGVEVAQSPFNFNITRGNIYNLFQPFTHVGVSAAFDVGPFSILVAGVNETRCFTACDVDINEDKAFMWSLGWSGETVGVSFNGITGQADSGAATTGAAAGGFLRPANGVTDDDRETILDFIVSWDPSEKFSSYVNVDYITTENSGNNGAGNEVDGWGVAVAGRYAFTERLGLALRGEYLRTRTEDAFDGVLTSNNDEFNIWAITGTFDYLLTDGLKVRLETRYDNVWLQNGVNPFFQDDAANTNDLNLNDQWVSAIEFIYEF